MDNPGSQASTPRTPCVTDIRTRGAYCPPPSARVDRAYARGRDRYPGWLSTLIVVGAAGALWVISLGATAAMLRHGQ